MKKTKEIIQAILDSYTSLKFNEESSLIEIPSRQSVELVLNHVKDILFPGFFSPQILTASALKKSTETRVNVIENLLTELIDKALPSPTSQKNGAEITETLLTALPTLRKKILEDAQAIFKGDPAAKSIPEIILSYPGLHAMLVYRTAHILHEAGVPIIPRLMSEIAHSQTGIDIHPGARIGQSMFIDHGTGIVIGETAEIGDFVKLYQGVTLGAFSVSKDTKGRRHPKLGNHVTVYARSTILGGDTVIGDHCVIGGNVWLTQSLPPQTTIYLSSDFKQIIKTQKTPDESA